MRRRRGRPHTLSSPVAMFTIIEKDQYIALRLLAFRSEWPVSFWIRVMIDLRKSGRRARHFFFRTEHRLGSPNTVISERTLAQVKRILPPKRNTREAPIRAAIVRYLTAS